MAKTLLLLQLWLAGYGCFAVVIFLISRLMQSAASDCVRADGVAVRPPSVLRLPSIRPSVRPFVVAARLFRKHNKCSIYFWVYVCVIPMAKKCNDSRDAADLRGKGHKNKEVSSARGNDSKLACTDLKIYCTPSELRASLPAQLCLENLELFLDGSTLSKNARFHCFASCISQYRTYSKCMLRYFDPLQYSDC